MKRLSLFLLLALAACAQNTAKYPAAVATEADLGIASNRAESTLTVPINATATSFTVASGAQFRAGMYASIDNEFVAICEVAGNTLKVGRASCPNVDGRGLDTANGAGIATSHLQNAKVQARISAWHHNQVAAEVRAVEEKLHSEYLSVKDFGAKGDGASDDTSAFSAALASLPSGGSLYIPGNSVYVIGSVIRITAGKTRIVGAGRSSIVRASGSGYNVFEVLANDVEFAGFAIEGAAAGETTGQIGIKVTNSAQRTVISGMYFGGPNASAGLNIGVMLDDGTGYSEVSRCTWERLIGITSGHGYGVLVGNAPGNRIIGNRGIFTATAGRHHIYLSNGTSNTEVSGNELYHGSNVQIQVYAKSTQPACQYNDIHDNVLSDMDSSADVTAAIDLIENASHNRVSGNVISGSGAHGIKIEANSDLAKPHGDNNKIADNVIVNAGLAGIHLYGASYTSVEGNRISGANAQASGYSGITIEPAGAVVPTENVLRGNFTVGATQIYGIHVAQSSGGVLPLKTILSDNYIGAGTTGDLGDEGSQTAKPWNRLALYPTAGATVFRGRLQFDGHEGLESATDRLTFAGGYGSPVSGKMYVGDGSGYKLIVSKRAGGVDGDLFSFGDDGVFEPGYTYAVLGRSTNPWYEGRINNLYVTGSFNFSGGFTGTKTAGSCVLTISQGVVIGVSGC